MQRTTESSLSSTENYESYLNALKRECCNDKDRLVECLLMIGCPFYHVVLLRTVDIARIMLEKGCDINAIHPSTQKTALHVVVERRDYSYVKFLIEHGADINAQDSSQNIPFAYFTSYNDSNEELQILQMILDRFTELTMRNRLHFLKRVLPWSRMRSLQILLRSNIDWCAEDDSEKTALNYFMRNPILSTNPDILELLRNKRIYDRTKENYNMDSVFRQAVRYGLVELVEVLLHQGANPNIKNMTEKSPLLDATCFPKYDRKEDRRKKIVALLLQYGADPQITEYSRTVFYNIVMFNENFDLANSIISQLAINEAFGTPLTLNVQDNIYSIDRFKHQFELCRVQLSEMKKVTICSSINLLDILNANKKDIAAYARNLDFPYKLTGIENFSKNPFYSAILQKNFQEIQFRKYTTDLVCKIMGISYNSYYGIIDKIIDYVTA